MEDLRFVDGYPEYMHESIRKVERTREARLGNLVEQMSPEERERVLGDFHPDFTSGGKRKIRVGHNRGDLAPVEVADQLEAFPLIDEKEIDLDSVDIETDILIVGGGLAGTSAALLANESGIEAGNILLVNKLRYGDSNSKMAQGGTQGADRPEDSPLIHYIDALGGGHFTNKPDVVRALVEDGPVVIKWLCDLGVMFDRN